MNLKSILLPGFFLVSLHLLTLIQGEEQKSTNSFSVVTMVPLVKLEKILIDNLEEYAKAMDHKLQIIRRNIQKMRRENKKAQLDAIGYLSNPLNGFSLVRRLHQDWVGWLQYMVQPVGASQIRNLNFWRSRLPCKEDLHDACEGLVRIQGNYELNITDIIRGKLQGRQHNASMSATDIFAVGNYLLNTSRPASAIQWLQEVAIHSQESFLPAEISVKADELLKLLALAHERNQSFPNALVLMESCLKLRPHDADLVRKCREIEELMGSPLNATLKEKKKSYLSLKEMAIACNATLKNPTGLHCFYNFNTTSFLRLAPLKVEQVGLHPQVLLYHEVLSPREITSIIRIAPQIMQVKTTTTMKKTNSQTHYRTAKFQWIDKEMSELGRRINRRIGDMTGFDLQDSESFQVDTIFHTLISSTYHPTIPRGMKTI
ncbi:prolyl 4-hydroxylase subunit alpha-2-like isoform X2 [Drosophila kikkawai]|uniref:Prolyl 4-hydroxylase subunit alpha-2-like isoform X2 n=1 Tax=Drosophila kikkawai TaxID=30033 RepID=A0ABM4GJI9_DROKI